MFTLTFTCPHTKEMLVTYEDIMPSRKEMARVIDAHNETCPRCLPSITMRAVDTEVN